MPPIYNLLPILAGTQFETSLSKQIAALHDLLIEKEQQLFEMTKSSSRIESLDEQIKVQKRKSFSSRNIGSNTTIKYIVKNVVEMVEGTSQLR